MSKSLELFLGSVLAASVLAGPAMADKLGLGREALPEEISAWDTAVLPDGQGLRPGSGDVATGDALFADNCASCHGDFAEGLDSWPVLAGGDGSLTDPRPVKTIGSYWPYLSTVYDYVHRSMPFGSAQTLSVDDTYAITAFLLYSNGLVEDDFVLTHENFTQVVLPNAEGFYPDDRDQTEYPLFSKEPCMTDCAVGVEITKRAVDLNVTPEDPDGRPAGSMPDLGAAAAPAEPAEPVEKKAEAAPAEAPAPAAAPEVVVKAAAMAPEAPAPAGAATAADPTLLAEGEKVFKKCAACHKVGDDAKNGTGPLLNGIVGRAAGDIEGFKYSKPLLAMASEGLVWDDASLHAFLENPKGFMKGTKMSFAGLKKEDERAAVIAYLATFAK
ncbi:c-type cytochrome [Paracoccus sp. P2]|uniref:C-type cytochrome n=3 Tax=Paracoccus TaxID=265 RepID=A0A1I5INZ2_PARPN|nr:c-type cytochrome [Paracoccus pantotrophus]CAA55825.1 cytochrome [Paracoccus denitrificans]MDF3855135.1 c-type cytochrome [Paracoccus pantotrophus]QFG35246.1 c-type cytochrome [Paracoccus pantotrophus]QLH13485.1 c-type cytochrome [Paracoccus pantotrophus]RDD95793.1 MFS transporter [Paracoccus pantotrophus]